MNDMHQLPTDFDVSIPHAHIRPQEPGQRYMGSFLFGVLVGVAVVLLAWGM